MKQIILSIALLLCLGPVSAQETVTGDKVNALPQVELRTLDGDVIDMSELSNNGNPIIISFWATWCKPCLQELIAISEVYPDWQDETGVLLVAVSIDDAKSTAKVPTVVNGRGWEYQVMLDPNQDVAVVGQSVNHFSAKRCVPDPVVKVKSLRGFLPFGNIDTGEKNALGKVD